MKATQEAAAEEAMFPPTIMHDLAACTPHALALFYTENTFVHCWLLLIDTSQLFEYSPARLFHSILS